MPGRDHQWGGVLCALTEAISRSHRVSAPPPPQASSSRVTAPARGTQREVPTAGLGLNLRGGAIAARNRLAPLNAEQSQAAQVATTIKGGGESLAETLQVRRRRQPRTMLFVCAVVRRLGSVARGLACRRAPLAFRRPMRRPSPPLPSGSRLVHPTTQPLPPARI